MTQATRVPPAGTEKLHTAPTKSSSTTPLRTESLRTGQQLSAPKARARTGQSGQFGQRSRLKLSSKQRFAMLEQLATLVDSGIQIVAALQSMQKQALHENTAETLSVLANSVSGGETLSSAMSHLPRAFPPLLVQMVSAGEATGDLGEMLRRTVETLEIEATLRSKLRSAMLYPCVMVVLTITVVTFLLAFIVPKFERIFTGRVLPVPTQILMSAGSFASNYGVYAVGALILIVIGLVLSQRTVRGERVWDRIMLGLPLFGDLQQKAVLARCSRTLGLLVKSGVPVHVAIEHAQKVAQSPAYAKMWKDAQTHVHNGGTLTEALRGHPLVDQTFQQVVAAGESTANLDEVMLKTAAQYSREVERKIRDLLTLIEPIMVVCMGAIVGFIALSIMLPIFRMSQS